MNDKIKILVIDDDPEIRCTLEAVLSAEGYWVETVETGTDAIRKTEEKCYNIALIDINLPDINGIQLLTKLKDGSPRMRKIIVTGYPTLPNAVDAVNKQANAYLIKPVDLPVMLETIKEQLGQQESENNFTETKIGEFIQNRARAFLESKKGTS
jgi:two-component system response regulator AtoC